MIIMGMGKDHSIQLNDALPPEIGSDDSLAGIPIGCFIAPINENHLPTGQMKKSGVPLPHIELNPVEFI